MSESFELKTTNAVLKMWEHPLAEAIVIKIDDWVSMTVDRGDGDEEEYEEGTAVIMMNLKSAEVLRDVLEYQISKLKKRISKTPKDAKK